MMFAKKSGIANLKSFLLILLMMTALNSAVFAEEALINHSRLALLQLASVVVWWW